jgi:hypothetical protein
MAFSPFFSWANSRSLYGYYFQYRIKFDPDLRSTDGFLGNTLCWVLEKTREWVKVLLGYAWVQTIRALASLVHWQIHFKRINRLGYGLWLIWIAMEKAYRRYPDNTVWYFKRSWDVHTFSLLGRISKREPDNRNNLGLTKWRLHEHPQCYL